MTAIRNRLKGLLRRNAIPARGRSVYHADARKDILAELPNAHAKWQLESQCRLLDQLRAERVGAHRTASRLVKKMPAVKLLRGIPGVGKLVSMTIVAWVMDPTRFKSMEAISAYGGIGLGQGITGWKVVSPNRASLRGSRILKRSLFLAARTAIRDIARKILFIACAIMRKRRPYDDTLLKIPTEVRTPPRRGKPRVRKAR